MEPRTAWLVGNYVATNPSDHKNEIINSINCGVDSIRSGGKIFRQCMGSVPISIFNNLDSLDVLITCHS